MIDNVQIVLDPTLNVPLYRQLSNRIENAILSGSLQRGDRLPPTRQLSADLNTARRTVVKAYDDLLNKGYLEGRVGVGTTVSRNLSPALLGEVEPIPASDESLEYRLSSYGKEVLKMNTTLVGNKGASGMLSGCLPSELLPVRQWRQLSLRHCKNERNDLDFQSEAAGYKPLRQAVAHYFARSKGVVCTPEQVIIFSGPQSALDLVVRLTVDHGDTVAIENPGSQDARDILASYGARLEPISVDSQGMVVDQAIQLGGAPKLAYVTPSCQNPTGAILSHDRRRALLAWARQQGVLIIEDARDSDYRYGHQVVASLQGLAPASVIYLYSFHKILFPLTDISVVVVPPKLVPYFSGARGLIEGYSVPVESPVLADFIQECHLDAHLSKTRRIFQERRQMIIHYLSTSFRQAVSIFPQSAGTQIMVRFDEYFDEEMILDCANRSGIPMISSRGDYVSGSSGNEFLIPFSMIDQETMRYRLENFASLMLMSAGGDRGDVSFNCAPDLAGPNSVNSLCG